MGMDARSWDRHIVERRIACRASGQDAPVFLYDLSAGGCMVEFSGDAPEKGQRLELDLCRDQVVPGEIVWQVAGCAGVRFLSPIHDALVRHLGFQAPPYTLDKRFVQDRRFVQDWQGPRDRFGRHLPPLGAGEPRGARRA